MQKENRPIKETSRFCRLQNEVQSHANIFPSPKVCGPLYRVLFFYLRQWKSHWLFLG